MEEPTPITEEPGPAAPRPLGERLADLMCGKLPPGYIEGPEAVFRPRWFRPQEGWPERYAREPQIEGVPITFYFLAKGPEGAPLRKRWAVMKRVLDAQTIKVQDIAWACVRASGIRDSAKCSRKDTLRFTGPFPPVIIRGGQDGFPICDRIRQSWEEHIAYALTTYGPLAAELEENRLSREPVPGECPRLPYFP